MSELTLEVLDAEETEQGYYEGWAVVGGEGVRDYRDKYGVLMFCPADELFAPETMKSARMLPVTPRHYGDVTPENWDELSIGVTSERPERRGNKLVMYFKITAAWAIEEIRKLKAAGKPLRFSLGYKVLPDKTPGTWAGRAYQWIMRRVRMNHLALLLDNSTPRHDGTGEINDSQNTDGELLLIMDSSEPIKTPQEGQKVKKKIPGSNTSIEIEDSDERDFDNFVTDYNDQATELSTAKGEIKKLERDLRNAQTNVTDSKGFEKAFNERMELALEAVELLDSVDIKELAKMSPLEIKEEVLLADGYTQDELDEIKEEEGDKYGAVIGGMYRRIRRDAGERESTNITDSASRASRRSLEKTGGRKVIKDTKVVEARQRQADRDKERKGAKA